jgi:hypothetical protein
MIDWFRYIWQLLVLSLVLLLLGILVLPRLAFELSLQTYLITLLSVTVINLISFLVMSRGVQKHNKDGVVYLLGGVALKFILYLLYILLFWLVTKNISKPFIVTFFALYLVFTFFLAGNLLKTLKNK